MAPQVRQAIAGHREHRDELGSEDEPDQPVDDGANRAPRLGEF
jgi:hypothetical protein